MDLTIRFVEDERETERKLGEIGVENPRLRLQLDWGITRASQRITCEKSGS